MAGFKVRALLESGWTATRSWVHSNVTTVLSPLTVSMHVFCLVHYLTVSCLILYWYLVLCCAVPGLSYVVPVIWYDVFSYLDCLMLYQSSGIMLFRTWYFSYLGTWCRLIMYQVPDTILSSTRYLVLSSFVSGMILSCLNLYDFVLSYLILS